MKTLIAAATLLALTTSSHAAPRGEWFLSLDAWFCSTKSCAIAGPPHEDFVIKDTFATRKQCLAKGRRLTKLAWHPGHTPITEDFRPTKDRSTLREIYELNGKGAGMTIAGFHPRCEWHRSIP